MKIDIDLSLLREKLENCENRCEFLKDQNTKAAKAIKTANEIMQRMKGHHLLKHQAS